jgi:dihydrofolate reductase/thymidylate synthase
MDRPKEVRIVVAATQKRGIGWIGDLPWPKIKEDFQHFQRLTTTSDDTEVADQKQKQNAVIVGRKTFVSIGKPLPSRFNIVVSQTFQNAQDLLKEMKIQKKDGTMENVVLVPSYEEAKKFAFSCPKINKVFVIGGRQIYSAALKDKSCKGIHLTQILRDFPCDVMFPRIPPSFQLMEVSQIQTTKDIPFQFLTYSRKEMKRRSKSKSKSKAKAKAKVTNQRQNLLLSIKKSLSAIHHNNDLQYRDLVQLVLETGESRGDRTGVGTISCFGFQLRLILTKDFPVLTLRQIFFRGSALELLWMISGCTNTNWLSEKGVKIWDLNSNRKFLDQKGFYERKEGDIGPMYGFQWRHAGAKYIDCNTDYKGQGVDQLAEVIRLIKQDPESRRIFLNSWNVKDLDLMCLPPCHVSAQFYVSRKRYLSCHVYQRSADLALGVPFNMIGYALLTHFIAHICDLTPLELLFSYGDVHIYKNHIEDMKELVRREPKPPPRLAFQRKVCDIDDFRIEDLKLVGYTSHPKMLLKMAV